LRQSNLTELNRSCIG